MRRDGTPRSAGLLALLLAALACASAPTQLYDGAPLPPSEVATLETEYARQIDIFAVDGKKVYGRAWHLAPGRHEVWTKIIRVETAGQSRFTMYAHCLFEVDAQAGGSYRIVPDTAVKAGANQKIVSVGALLVDSLSHRRSEPAYCGEPPDLSD